ncbi:MAG: START domain-containing protein [Sphingobacteriales bacterium]|jgi:hypothetical protein|nr:MAG: START domain-containing protein [Sphingobacteriales bacterium]
MKRVVLILTLMMSTYIISSAQNNWELEKEKDGIKVWTKKREGSKLKEYKGVTIVQTSVDKLLAVFKNVKAHEKLFYKCKKGSVSLVKKSNDDDFYTYMVFEAPLVKNRDAITHFKFSPPSPDGSVTIYLEAAPTLVPYKPDFVRVPEMKGYWKFAPKSNGTVEVTHQAYSSPGGGLPESMANIASVDAPFTMLSALKSLLGN